MQVIAGFQIRVSAAHRQPWRDRVTRRDLNAAPRALARAVESRRCKVRKKFGVDFVFEILIEVRHVHHRLAAKQRHFRTAIPAKRGFSFQIRVGCESKEEPELLGEARIFDARSSTTVQAQNRARHFQRRRRMPGRLVVKDLVPILPHRAA